jgi:hypothetical protein
LIRQKYFLIVFSILISFHSISQDIIHSPDVNEIGETMEDFIQENHIEDIEDMIHKFMDSQTFLQYLLKQGHDIDIETLDLKRKDVNIGNDLDVYVKHLTEHQNFTMIMVPVDIYPLTIYDTLLFSVLEVSDTWLHKNHFREDLDDLEVKARILSDENHHMLTNHMYNQVLSDRTSDLTEVEIKLHESYISTNSILVDTKALSNEEKESVLKDWGFLKRIMTHDINLNVEINIYIFGHDDMSVIKYTKEGSQSFRITPNNIFTRHHFMEK